MLPKASHRVAVASGVVATATAAAVLIGMSTSTVQAIDESARPVSVTSASPTPSPSASASKGPRQFSLVAPPAPPAAAPAAGKPLHDPWPVIEPIQGAAVTGSFGTRGPHWAVAHSGADISAETGTAVRAVFSGTIRSTFVHRAYGIVVRLVRADGVEIWYCHLSRPLVLPGQKVRQGQPVGLSGATGNVTGPHLHLEVRVNHVPTDPLAFFLVTPGKPAPAPAWAQAYKEDPPPGTSAR